MVVRSIKPDTGDIDFEVLPNGSLSWGVMKAIFGLMLGFSAVVTAYFCWKGAWLVLPFTGLEMLVLAAGMYLSACWSSTREVITVQANSVIVRRGRRRVSEECRFQRHWAQVLLLRDPAGWYPSRLLIRSHGRSLQVGAALVEGEREQLAQELAQVVAGWSDSGAASPAVEAGVLVAARQQV